MHRSVLFDIIVSLHWLTISADCVMLIENKTKFHLQNVQVYKIRGRGEGRRGGGQTAPKFISYYINCKHFPKKDI